MTTRLVPQNNPINERALSLGPRLSLFSKVSYRPFPHYALVSKYKEIWTRLGWTISYKSLYFVHPSLDLMRLFYWNAGKVYWLSMKERFLYVQCFNFYRIQGWSLTHLFGWHNWTDSKFSLSLSFPSSSPLLLFLASSLASAHILVFSLSAHTWI